MGRITIDQSHQIMSALAVNTNWGEIDFDTIGLQDAIIRNPKGAGTAFTAWLKSGANTEAIAKAPLPPKKTKKVEMDSIIRVDRSIRPSYPDWVKRVEHPDLEPTGPAEYDISAVKQWLHYGQKDGKWIEGNKIYAHFKETDMLKPCLGLRDLEEIQKKGIIFFRKHFQSKAVFGWKSVVLDRDGGLDVPYLYEYGGEVVLHWYWLDCDWSDGNPALRFAS